MSQMHSREITAVIAKKGIQRKLTSSKGGPDGLSEIITMPLSALLFFALFFGMVVSLPVPVAGTESLTASNAVKFFDAPVFTVPMSGASFAERPSSSLIKESNTSSVKYRKTA